ncbi:MAG: 50S ribosomal protein L4 [Alphaproteobacteria bacterium]
MKIDILNLDGKAVGNITLADAVFGMEKRTDLLARVVNWQLAKARQGSANTKVRHEISRTTKKYFAQKGTGNARHGDRKNNIFVGGATQFGPRPKDFTFSLPKKVRQLALKSALSSKMADKQLVVIDTATLKTGKTKDLLAKLTKMELTNATFIVDSIDANFDRASRNLPHIKVLPTEGANVYDILHNGKVVLTEAAVKMLEGRLLTDGADVAEKPAKAKKAAAPKAESAEKPAKKAAAPKAAKADAAEKPAKKAAPKKAAKKETE